MDVMILFKLLFELFVIGLVAWVLFWGIGKVALAEPFNKIAVALVVLIVVVLLVNVLLALGGGTPLIRWR